MRRMVREVLLKDRAAEARFAGLKNAAPSPDSGAVSAWETFARIPRPFDLTLLGMGDDGHTASLVSRFAESVQCIESHGGRRLRRHEGALGAAGAAELEPERSARFAAHADRASRARRSCRTYEAANGNRSDRGDAGAGGVAPEPGAGRGDLGAMKEKLGDRRTDLDKEAIKSSFLDDLFYMQGKFPALATKNDYYMALAYAVRDRMLHRWISTAAAYTRHGSRTVAYLSAEFLMGPHLGNNLLNLGILEPVRQCMKRARPRFRRAVAAGRGARTRQRRPRPSGGMLHRLARHARDPRAWAMASATNSASSIKRSSTAGRSRGPTSGCARAIPGNWCVRSGR